MRSISRPSHEIGGSSQPVQDGAQTLNIVWHPDRSDSSRGTSLIQRDSKLSHGIEASGQSVQDAWRTNPEIAQCPERSDTNSMPSPNIERK